MRYYLIGMMLSGKSTIAKLLKDKYNYETVDLDNYIEIKENRTISEIFNTYGENYFRALETRYLKEVNNKYKVIALGGGTPLYNDLEGKIIFLNPPLESLLTRINPKEIYKRPLLKNVSDFINLYNKRVSSYLEIADIVISNTEISEILDIVRSVINEENISN